MSHSAALVFVASPETPVMFRCAASGPTRKSAGRLHTTPVIDADGDSPALAIAQVAIHAQRCSHIGVVSELHPPHRHRLHRLLGDLAQDGSAVEPDLRPLGGRGDCVTGLPIMPQHIVQRGLEIGVGEPFGDHTVDDGYLTVDRPFAVHANDAPDTHRGVQSGPEMELESGVRAPLGGHHPTEGREGRGRGEGRIVTHFVAHFATDGTH